MVSSEFWLELMVCIHFTRAYAVEVGESCIWEWEGDGEC